jgi:hypothetical protein
MSRLKPLWQCPKCGYRFVTANLAHACGRYPLARHFEGKDPLVRRLYERFVRVVRAQGRVTVIPQKTRIAVMVRVRFAAVITNQRWMDATLWLTRHVEHPCLRRVQVFGPRAYIHTLRFTALDQFDAGLSALVAEAYAVGCQAHLGEGLSEGRSA